jgi:hypothetical protein
MTTATATKEQNGREVVTDIAKELTELRGMTVGKLREKYREVFGIPTRSRNKDYLFKKIAWRIQELAEGGLSKKAGAKIDELAPETPVRWKPVRDPAIVIVTPVDSKNDEPGAEERDPRLPPPGTMLTRMFKGVEHKVLVHDDGFEYQGERYTSLSTLARMITGTNWNGFLFFGRALREAKERAQ